MRVRILAAVVVLLAGSSAVSIALLRSVLLDRLDEEITVGLQREIEEFQLLADGLNPRTGAPFGDDFDALFEVYFAREVPDEGEALLAFRGSTLVTVEEAPDAPQLDEFEDAIEYWLELDEFETGVRQTNAGEARYAALPLSGQDGDGLLLVANFPAGERAEINGAVGTQVLIQFGTIAAASLIGLALAGRVLRPLGSLADTAQTISATDLTRRIPVRGRDEASRIATAFNDMLGRLERAFDTQRQFLDDANHELRAPLTVIRGHVELLPLLDDPDERQEAIELIVGEIERMNRIVDELLLLARSERPGFLDVAPVDLADLTLEVHRKSEVLCDHSWVLEASAHAVIEADAQRLTQAMVQFADNACKHTPAGTTVRIGSAFRNGDVVLWVHDDGPGVPAEESTRIFQRFVKGSSTARGSGLGLSIVAAIAEAHGGRARLAPSERGARFEIVLPREESPTAVTARRLSTTGS
jgi:signal transduction histidine kinase